MSILNLTSTQLRHAADLKEQIADLEGQLAALGGGTTVVPVAATKIKPAKKGGMSAAGRARIAEAQKLRWARVNAAKTKSVAAVEPRRKTRRKMSAAGRAAIAAAARARWAKVRTANK